MGASPWPEKCSPESKPVGDGGVGIAQGSPGDVSSAETEHSAPLFPPPGNESALQEPWGKSCLGWIRRTLGGSVQGSCIFSSGSRQDQATGPRCSQLDHNPSSLGGKDTNISGQGRSSPDVFTPAVEAVGGLFSSLPQSGRSRGGSAASTSNLRQGKSDPALTVAVLPWGRASAGACLPARPPHKDTAPGRPAFEGEQAASG